MADSRIAVHRGIGSGTRDQEDEIRDGPRGARQTARTARQIESWGFSQGKPEVKNIAFGIAHETPPKSRYVDAAA